MTATHPDPDRLWATASATLASAAVYAICHAPAHVTSVERLEYIAAAVDRYKADMERVEQASRAVV